MYKANANRYELMRYNRCGKSGLLLPAISLGLWQNFGNRNDFNSMREIIHFAFDHGITHFDLANNYGPPPGEAEINFGKILKNDLWSYRDEIIISTKAGYYMWPGPYGEWGSRKHLIASIDQSLKRLGVEYVDIFYSHRPDPDTPIEETMMALDHIVRSEKALYAGISSYSAEQSSEAIDILRKLDTPCLIHQPRYSMFDRWVENGLLNVLADEKVGCITFSPLAQGLLTDKYLNGIPGSSRAGRGLGNGALQQDDISPSVLEKIRKLNQLAIQRKQSLAQMSIAWLMRDNRITSVLVGASSVAQLKNSIGSLQNVSFTNEELSAIEDILK